MPIKIDTINAGFNKPVSAIPTEYAIEYCPELINMEITKKTFISYYSRNTPK